MEEALALCGVDLLRVVQQRERPDAVAAQCGVVEQHARDDQRPGERPATGLVGARDEPNARAVGRSGAAAGRSEVAPPEDSPRSRTTSCRLRAARPTRPARPGPAARALTRTPCSLRPSLQAHLGRHARHGRHELHAEPVASTVGPAHGADDDARLALDEPGTRVPGAVDVPGIVRRVAGDGRLDRLASESLRVVLHTAAREEEDATAAHDQREDGAHDVNVVVGARSAGYDWRSSRTRDFLPTRPRR